MTTHAEVAASADVQKAIPALASLAASIGDRQVRNVGTIGGSLAGNWSAAAIARVKVPASGLSSDLHGSAEYRAHLIGVLGQRAVTAAQ